MAVDRARPAVRPVRREEVLEVLAGSANDPRTGLRRWSVGPRSEHIVDRAPPALEGAKGPFGRAAMHDPRKAQGGPIALEQTQESSFLSSFPAAAGASKMMSTVDLQKLITPFKRFIVLPGTVRCWFALRAQPFSLLFKNQESPEEVCHLPGKNCHLRYKRL